MIKEAKELLARVTKENEDVELAKQALYKQASCCIALGDANAALELLEGTNAPSLYTETLLIAAYQMTGKTENAKAGADTGELVFGGDAMRNYIAFTKKELLESIRTYKLLIMLIVFFVFGIMSPLAAKMMPEILGAAMPETICHYWKGR